MHKMSNTKNAMCLRLRFLFLYVDSNNKQKCSFFFISSEWKTRMDFITFEHLTFKIVRIKLSLFFILAWSKSVGTNFMCARSETRALFSVMRFCQMDWKQVNSMWSCFVVIKNKPKMKTHRTQRTRLIFNLSGRNTNTVSSDVLSVFK